MNIVLLPLATTVNREYFSVTKVTWSKCLMNFNFVNLAGFNDEDRYAVAVLKDDTVVGHISRKTSQICSLFVAWGGAVTCTSIGGRRYSCSQTHLL